MKEILLMNNFEINMKNEITKIKNFYLCYVFSEKPATLVLQRGIIFYKVKNSISNNMVYFSTIIINILKYNLFVIVICYTHFDCSPLNNPMNILFYIFFALSLKHYISDECESSLECYGTLICKNKECSKNNGFTKCYNV